MIREEEVYKIGKIGKPHGVKGEMSFMFDDDVFDRVDADYIILLIDGILVPFFIEEYRFRSEETALIKLCDIDTQEKARELTNCNVYFPRSLSDSACDDMALAEIVGFRIVSENSEKIIGTITAIDTSTENILFEVEALDGKVLLIPAAQELIKDINTENRQITVELPEGLLDLE